MSPAPEPLLLVEDDADLADVIREVLEAEGFSVVHTANGLEALEWLAQGQRPALVLLDIRMPRMNGWELLDRLHATPEYTRLPVVVLSTAKVNHPSVAAFLRKPFEPALLAATVRQLLAPR